MIDLSILVCGVLNRYDTFLPKIQQQLYEQYEKLPESDKAKVEIIVLVDNKKMMLGNKRNNMITLAQGKYIQFVDDDDRIASDFIKSLLAATRHNTDCIVFQAEVTINDKPPRICYYSKDNGRDYNTKEAFYRIPNHISCIKKEVSLKSSFPNIKRGEDSGYSKLLLKHLKTEYKIDKVLYYYDYNDATSETQEYIPNKNPQNSAPPLVDVIFLSKASSTQTRTMTQKAIDSCINGADGLPINIIVLEQGYGSYKGAKTIPMRKYKFNYNAFANYGAKNSNSEWIMISNNDVTFTDGWLHYLLAAEHPIVSPHEPNDSRQKNIKNYDRGYEVGRHLSGWCFMIKRSLWKEIGGFDSDVDFWFSDDVVVEQVKKLGIEPMIVKDSIVHHLASATLNKLPTEKQQDLKWRNAYIFNKKYSKKKFANHPEYQTWLKNNQLKGA